MAQAPPQAVLVVADPARTLGFYCDQLGFERLPGGSQSVAVRGPGGAVLLLHAAAAPPTPGVRSPALGAWVYLQRSEVAALGRELRARGLAVTGPEEPYPGFRRLLVTDPDGYVLVFWEAWPLPDDQVLALYAGGPQRLAAAVAGLAAHQLDLCRAPGKWSVRQIVHHVVDSDLATFEVLRLALAEPGRQITTNPWDADVWAAGLDYAHRPIAPGLGLLAAVRGYVHGLVEHLPGALDRTAVWPSGYQAPVRRLLQQVGGHALGHIAQIWEVRRRYHITPGGGEL